MVDKELHVMTTEDIMENSVLDRKQVEIIRAALKRQAAIDSGFVESGDYEMCMFFLDCVEMSLK